MTTIQHKLTADTKRTSKLTTPNFNTSRFFQSALTKRQKRSLSRGITSLSNYAKIDKVQHQDTFHQDKSSLKILLDANLPNLSKTQHKMKRSTYLQMWLDEALDSQQKKIDVGVKEYDYGPLKTVRKYEIDRIYLKSQNVSSAIIQKIYNTLYVYTQGLNHAFEQLIENAKVNQQFEKKIMNIFWRSFTKLLQGCNSYRTVFQVVEENHLKAIAQMKQNKIIKEDQYNKELSRLQKQIIRLNKRIYEQGSMITKLTKDCNIAESTLQLTDEAFNNEVQLRLKFEEKVNSLFVSYDEIKVKYDNLLGELKVKNESLSEVRNSQILLKNTLENNRIQIEQLQKCLARQKLRVIERQKQIAQRREQIFHLNNEIQIKYNNRQSEEDSIKLIISKSNKYKSKIQELQNNLKIKQTIISQQQKTINNQNICIEQYRQKNQILYDQIHQIGLQQSQAQFQRQLVQKQLAALKLNVEEHKQRWISYQELATQLNQKIQSLTNSLSLCQNQIDIKNKLIIKNSDTIQDLKAVKTKFQNLYKIGLKQKNDLEISRNQYLSRVEQFSEQSEGMKLLLQSKQIELSQANSKLENEREVFRAKINNLRQQIATKQKQILGFKNKQDEDQECLQQVNQSKVELEKTIEKLRVSKLSNETQIVFCKKMIKQLQNQRLQNRKQIEMLNNKIETLEILKLENLKNLDSQSYILDTTKDEKSIEAEYLRKLVDQYKDIIEKKISYIHPLIYEDLCAVVRRNYQKQVQYKKDKDELKKYVTQLEKQNREQKIVITGLKQQNQELKKCKEALKVQIKGYDKLKHQFQDKTNTISKLNILISSTTKQYKQCQSKFISALSTINQLQKINEQKIRMNKELLLQIDVIKEQIAAKKAEIEQKDINIEKLKHLVKNSNQKNNFAENIQNPIKITQEYQNKIVNKVEKKQSYFKEKITTDKQVQTDKIKVVHQSKFQVQMNDYSCQVSIQQKKQVGRSFSFDSESELNLYSLNRRDGQKIEQNELKMDLVSQQEAKPQLIRQKQARRIESKQFKRALRITYMRR